MIQLFDGAWEISLYWLMRGLAVVLAMVYASCKQKVFCLTNLDVIALGGYTFFGAVVGGKGLYLIGQILMNHAAPAFWTTDSWREMAKAGGVLYGSVFGAVAMILLFCKIFEYKASDLLAFASIIFFGANFFCRIGCFLAGCCYGVRMPNGSLFPYQLTEGLICAIIFIIFLIWKPEKNHKELLVPLFFILYGAIRFVLEFFRGDTNRGVWLLSTSQWIGVILIPLGIMLLLKVERVMKRDF